MSLLTFCKLWMLSTLAGMTLINAAHLKAEKSYGWGLLQILIFGLFVVGIIGEVWNG